MATKKAAAASAKAKANGTSGEDQISGPYSLHHRFKPIGSSQCYLMGNVADQPKTFITNVSVKMSHDFSKIMQQIFKLWTVRTIAQRGVRRFAVHLKQGVCAVYFRGWREGMHHQQAILQPRLEQLAACIDMARLVCSFAHFVLVYTFKVNLGIESVT